jgi:hypothetical protein
MTPLLEGDRQPPAESGKKVQNGRRFGFQYGFHDDIALGIPHCDRDRCLVNIHPKIALIVLPEGISALWISLRSPEQEITTNLTNSRR